MALTNQATQTHNGEKKNYSPLPDGDYLVKMDRVSEEVSKRGGTYVKASFSVKDGDFKKRLIFQNFMINLPYSPEATKIGKEQLDKCLKAMGVSNGFAGIGNDATQLESFLGREIIVNVGTKEGTNGYPARNYVKKWIAS